MDEAEALAVEPAADIRPTEPAKAKPWIFVVAAVVVLLCGVGFFANSKSAGGPDTFGAKQACEGFVKDRLKAPATADFSGEDVTTSGSTYTVTGSVDAENSFGAKLRSQFTCVVLDAGSEWRLQSLSGL